MVVRAEFETFPAKAGRSPRVVLVKTLCAGAVYPRTQGFSTYDSGTSCLEVYLVTPERSKPFSIT